MSTEPHKRVTRRQVFYIPGYDPIHPRRYRELYRKEGAAQAQISGYTLSLSPKTAPGPYGWQVDAQIDGQQTHSDFEVLVWSDIVRDSMAQGILSTYGQMARTAWIYIASGALWRLMKLRKGPVIAALYPVAALLLQLLLAIALGLGGGYGVDALVVWGLTPFTAPETGAMLGGLAGLVTVPLIAMVVLRWFKARDGKFFAYYLMHDYAYSAQLRGANPPALDQRMAEFGERITQALTQEYDEVLIVGHSSGAHLAVSILAELQRSGEIPQKGPVLSFLSLGQVVPMVSFLPAATTLRRDLRDLAAQDQIAWVDVTAPGDGCAFALCDPVAVTGVSPEPDRTKNWPLVFSAAFTQSLSPERWAQLRWRFFRLHFQYLCAFDRPRDYDYFQITAGPKQLWTRYHGRPASRSRLEKPVSKYQSVS